ncbi:hypothetical protein C494_20213 [Natronorubrum bangense JCM 10635]|uniref:Uncharacterized protein n=1 Tax=Natronorubrum bangense JCM 10635 TaxID=1227500 RepID=L9W2W5_9EURY|nr:hypothetical protein C494_20213 [Natronorubrum bangense JCM 10635]
MFFLRSNAVADESSSPSAKPGSRRDESDQLSEPGTTQADTQTGELVRGSRLYVVTTGATQMLESSVLLGWILGKEEPRQIVIDLRKPQVVTTLRRFATWGYRTVLRLSATSAVAGVIYRSWTRVRERPIRIGSIGVLILTLLVLLADTASDGSIGPSTLMLVGVLVVAAHGTRKTQSWEELATTRWYRSLVESRTSSASSEVRDRT